MELVELNMIAQYYCRGQAVAVMSRVRGAGVLHVITVLLCCCAFTSMLAAKHVAVCKDVSDYIPQHQGVLLNFTGLTNMVYLVIAHRN